MSHSESIYGDSKFDELRSTLGGYAVGRVVATLGDATATLFEAGGKELLDEEIRRVLAERLATGASELLASEVPLLAHAAAKQMGAASKHLAGGAAAETGKAVTRQATRGALKVVAGGVARGVALGFVIDGVFGAYEGIGACRRGEITKAAALVHSAKEASKGGVASAAAVGLTAAAAVVLGPVAAAPVALFAIGAAVSIGTKAMLDRCW